MSQASERAVNKKARKHDPATDINITPDFNNKVEHVEDAAAALGKLGLSKPSIKIQTRKLADSPSGKPDRPDSTPGSPKKRKAASSMGHDSIFQEEKVKRNYDGHGDISHARGALGQLLLEFGKMELNLDLLEKIRRTESCTGLGGQKAGPPRADRVSFEHAVKQTSSVMTAQIDLLEQDYRHDTHMFNSMLRAYAARAIAVFSAEESSLMTGPDEEESLTEDYGEDAADSKRMEMMMTHQEQERSGGGSHIREETQQQHVQIVGPEAAAVVGGDQIQKQKAVDNTRVDNNNNNVAELPLPNIMSEKMQQRQQPVVSDGNSKPSLATSKDAENELNPSKEVMSPAPRHRQHLATAAAGGGSGIGGLVVVGPPLPQQQQQVDSYIPDRPASRTAISGTIATSESSDMGASCDKATAQGQTALGGGGGGSDTAGTGGPLRRSSISSIQKQEQQHPSKSIGVVTPTQPPLLHQQGQQQQQQTASNQQNDDNIITSDDIDGGVHNIVDEILDDMQQQQDKVGSVKADVRNLKRGLSEGPGTSAWQGGGGEKIDSINSELGGVDGGNDDRGIDGGNEESTRNQNWGSSLVCADLTLDDVSGRWPFLEQVHGIENFTPSGDQDALLDSFVVALNQAIVDSCTFKPSPAFKSLVTATVLDDLSKERCMNEETK